MHMGYFFQERSVLWSRILNPQNGKYGLKLNQARVQKMLGAAAPVDQMSATHRRVVLGKSAVPPRKPSLPYCRPQLCFGMLRNAQLTSWSAWVLLLLVSFLVPSSCTAIFLESYFFLKWGQSRLPDCMSSNYGDCSRFQISQQRWWWTTTSSSGTLAIVVRWQVPERQGEWKMLQP